jgi:hypothetical protein
VIPGAEDFKNSVKEIIAICRVIVLFMLFYYQINLAFFCKKAFKHQVTKKEPKTQK